MNFINIIVNIYTTGCPLSKKKVSVLRVCFFISAGT